MNFTFKKLLLSLNPELQDLHTNRQIKIVRHKMGNRTDQNWEGFDQMIRFDRDLLRTFTAEQRQDKFKPGDLIFLFIATNSTRCILVETFECISRIDKFEYQKLYSDKINDYFEYKKQQSIPTDSATLIHYNLINSGVLMDLHNRLVIDWGTSTQSWVQRELDKDIWEILPKGFVSDFPGWDKVIVTHRELEAIIQNPDGNREWEVFLKSHDGVYVIHDTKTKENYVGSASGDEGLWHRLQGYVMTGHNYNKGLMELFVGNYDNSRVYDFVYSLHHVCAKHSKSKNEVLTYESMLKKKINPKLNRN
jgi:hypothetical protein